MRATRPVSQHILGIGLTVVVLSGCGSGISVQTDWDPGVDFSAFNTFAVLDEATGGGGLDQLTQNRIKTSITNTLQAKGMRQVDDPREADAAVGWQVTTEERSSFQTVNTGWSNYGWGWNRGWHGSTMRVELSREGCTLTVVDGVGVPVVDAGGRIVVTPERPHLIGRTEEADAATGHFPAPDLAR